MSRRRKKWLYATSGITLAVIIALLIAAAVLSRRFEPFLRQQAISYLSDQFHCDVELASLKVHLPKFSPLNILLRKGRGTQARVDGTGISMRYRDAQGLPQLFSIQKFSFVVDLGSLISDLKIVDHVQLDGMQINVPPKEDRRPLTNASSGPEAQKSDQQSTAVLIRQILIHNGTLTILPKDKTKVPLQFDLQKVTLRSAGTGRAMKYDADLTNPKPPGQIHAVGEFGPWAADDPGDSPIKGDYVFDHADLGVFKSIAGILSSTGQFEGALSSIKAKGQARVPDFRLTMANNPVPLFTKFEVLVDGTNGNTTLQPVQATLGSTKFQTSGGVIKHEGDKRRSIDLDVLMPKGNLRDVLRLAMKGSPFMEGQLFLKTQISIPPLSGKVREKLRLKGQFQISNGKFLKSTIQDELDKLSRRAQGEPESKEIDEVVSRMKGTFSLENEQIHFSKLAFQIPGADIDLSGLYNMDADNLDFTGTVKLQAKVSQTMTGWKRVALKPVDPFFAKNGAGTFLRISVQGSSRKPKFGLVLRKKSEPDSARARTSQK